MTRYLPICLDLRGRRAVIIGGGLVGTQKVADFRNCGAEVTVVSPEVTGEIRDAALSGAVTWIQRAYQPGDTEGAFLVIAATDDPDANAAVFAEASAAGRLVNVCDDPDHCNYIFASKVERGPLAVSIFTHGTAPALAKRVRCELEAWLGPEYGALAELLAELRPRVKALEGSTQPERQRIFERIVYSEVLLLYREGNSEAARSLAERLIAEELQRREE